MVPEFIDDEPTTQIPVESMAQVVYGEGKPPLSLPPNFSEWLTCYDCGGRGTVLRYLSPQAEYQEPDECSACDGTGLPQYTAEMAMDAMAEAQQLGTSALTKLSLCLARSIATGQTMAADARGVAGVLADIIALLPGATKEP